MSLSTTLTSRAASIIERRTSRRSFVGRSAMVGSALAVSGTGYVLRPGTAYAAICRCPRQATNAYARSCGCGDLCCDGYTEFCCQLYGQNSCPPDTLLAGWWKVDNSVFCDGAARYYMDCNRSQPACSCGASGVCRGADSTCQCRSCSNRADDCTVFRYGNCNNDVLCVGPILCRVVTCTKPWEIDPGCSTVPRTDPATANHHRPCLEPDFEPSPAALAWVQAMFADYIGREPSPTELTSYANRVTAGEDRASVSLAFARTDVYIAGFLDALYQSVFGRGVDDAGRQFWTDQIRRGLKPAAVASELYGSDEFFAASGGLVEFVQRLYAEILGRDADPGGLEYWVGRLLDGVSRAEVSAPFYGSIESRRRRVTTLYQHFLGRDSDPAGLDYWAEQLLDGDDLRLATFLTGSAEYDQLAQWRFA
jgi:hypothetical protein